MQATRQQILDFLREHGEASVRQLGAHLQLTATGVRQHLGILERDGLVASRDVRGRVGRPALAYRLTSRGEALYPKAYDRLALAMIGAARRNLDDRHFVELIQDAAAHLARPHHARVAHGGAGQRLDALCEVLREQEIVVDYQRTEDGYVLEQRTCPFHEAAEAAASTCDLDTALLSAITSLPVTLVQSRARGDAACTFLIRTTPVPDAPAPATRMVPASDTRRGA